jgi:PqqA peptide cyclase
MQIDMSREQLADAETVVRAAKERLKGRMEIIYVIPDYYSRYPKPCMDGWARRQLTVVPNGEALPCPTAHDVVRGHGLAPANVREHSLRWIWQSSPVFQKFRGTEWMPEPCGSCPRREIDFRGCRCQAFALTGDAARRPTFVFRMGHADQPARLSPRRPVEAVLAA